MLIIERKCAMAILYDYDKKADVIRIYASGMHVMRCDRKDVIP